MAQLVEHPALGFCSGRDLGVMRSSPITTGSALSRESAWSSLSPSAPQLVGALLHTLSKINNKSF